MTLDELEALAKKATPAPWKIIPDVYGEKEEAWCNWHELGPFTMTGKDADDDGRFIVAMRNAVPALLAAIRAADAMARKMIYEHGSTLHKLKDDYDAKRREVEA